MLGLWININYKSGFMLGILLLYLCWKHVCHELLFCMLMNLNLDELYTFL